MSITPKKLIARYRASLLILLHAEVVSLSRFAFSIHPLSYVPRALHDFRPIGLARSEEPNHLHVHDSYLRQIQDKPRSVILELLFQFGDVLRLELTTQTDRGASALRSHFDLHVPATLIQAFTAARNACIVPMQISRN
jgi:hypothetical protein